MSPAKILIKEVSDIKCTPDIKMLFKQKRYEKFQMENVPAKRDFCLAWYLHKLMLDRGR